MEAIIISPKFRITIPNRIRKLLGLRPGQKVRIILYDNRIELIPVCPVKEARGFLKGIDTNIDREEDRV